MARGPYRANERASHQHRVGSRWISFNVVRGLINVPRDAPDSRRIWCMQGARGASTVGAANVLHDLRLDLAS